MKPRLIVVAGPNGAGKTTINDVDPIQLFRTVDGEIVRYYNELIPWAKDLAEQIAKQSRNSS